MRTHARSVLVGAVATLLLVAAGAELAGASIAAFWTKRVGGTSSEFPQAMAIDASGNVIVAGYFFGSCDFGSGVALTSFGQSDVFIAKYSPTGAHIWSAHYGGTGFDSPSAIALDAFGNVYATGTYRTAANFGGASLTGFGIDNMWIAKYTSAGAHVWSKGFGKSAFNVSGTGLAVTPSGVVYLTGYFDSSVNLGGSTLTSAGSQDIYLARFDTAGNHFWSQKFGSTGSDYQTSVVVSALNDVYLCGQFSGSVNFGGGALVGLGSQEAFLAKYNSAGTHQWSKRFGNTGADEADAVELDASGNVIVAGAFQLSADFGGGALGSLGGTDVFLAEYTAAGAHVWSKRFGGTSDDFPADVAADAAGNLALTGWFNGNAAFGGATLTNAGNEGIFLARYNSSGVHQWSYGFGSTDFDDGWAVGFDAAGNVHLAASFIGTVDFGLGNLTTPTASTDMVLARYGAFPREPAVSSIVDVKNDQGRVVKISFQRSGHDDSGSPTAIQQYEVFRRDDAPPAFAANTAAMTTPELLIAGWQFVGSAPAHHDDTNLVSAPTVGDSTITLGQYYSTFFMRAATSNPVVFYDSPIDSGYSVDNLAPPAPQNFAYDAGDLSWLASIAADFNYFTVYGSSSQVLDGSAVVVGHTTGIALDASASPHTYYYLTATDYSGNEGKPARVNTLSGAGGGLPPRALPVSAYPNPFNPRTRIQYTIPARGKVSIVVYDAHGARVVTLFDGERSAGAYSVDWNGRTDNAAVAASGVYFVEVRLGGQSKTHKLTLVK